MAERRMLHRKVSVSADLAALDAKHGPRAVLFYTWLIPQLDRWGCAPADAATLLGMVGPLWRGVDDKEVGRWITWMVRRGLLERVEGPSGERGIRVPKFHKHQAGTKWDREGVSLYEPADVTAAWTRTRSDAPKSAPEQHGPGPVPDQSGTGPPQSKAKEGKGRSRPTPLPSIPSPHPVESAAAPPEPSPGAQSPPPGVNGHGEPERVDLDAVEQAMSPTMAGAVRRARRTTKHTTRGSTA